MTQSVDAIDHLGQVLFLVEISELKDEALWKTNITDEEEEVVDVIRMAKVKLRCLESEYR